MPIARHADRPKPASVGRPGSIPDMLRRQSSLVHPLTIVWYCYTRRLPSSQATKDEQTLTFPHGDTAYGAADAGWIG